MSWPVSNTSREAHASVDSRVVTMRDRVLHCVVRHAPVTDERIADLLEMNPSTVRPRRIELVRDGLIVEAGFGVTRSGRRAVQWAPATDDRQLSLGGI